MRKMGLALTDDRRWPDGLCVIIVHMRTFKAVSLSSEEEDLLRQWGEGLRVRRIERQETQAQTAARLGLSVSTYRRMESGDKRTPLGHWVRALALCRVLPAMAAVLAPSLFSEGLNRRRVRTGRAPTSHSPTKKGVIHGP